MGSGTLEDGCIVCFFLYACDTLCVLIGTGTIGESTLILQGLTLQYAGPYSCWILTEVAWSNESENRLIVDGDLYCASDLGSHQMNS